MAISTTLFLGAAFRLPLRQTEGFVHSLMDLMGFALPVPDHTPLSRRRRTVDVALETGTNKRSTDIVLDSTGLKFFGAGESRARHGETRRSWRKLHISVDPAGSEIRAHELTGDDTADATMAGPLVAGSGGKRTARTFQSQQNEIAIQIGVLNRSGIRPLTKQTTICRFGQPDSIAQDIVGDGG